MAKVILLCGKIASGKSYWADILKREQSAVVLSCDELLLDLGMMDLGEKHDEVLALVKQYLYKKAMEINGLGINVILDFGFWRKSERQDLSTRLQAAGINFEWYYIDISDEDWASNIDLRNKAVEAGQQQAYIIDEGLLKKLADAFQVPEPDEVDVWIKNIRKRNIGV